MILHQQKWPLTLVMSILVLQSNTTYSNKDDDDNNKGTVGDGYISDSGGGWNERNNRKNMGQEIDTKVLARSKSIIRSQLDRIEDNIIKCATNASVIGSKLVIFRYEINRLDNILDNFLQDAASLLSNNFEIKNLTQKFITHQDAFIRNATTIYDKIVDVYNLYSINEKRMQQMIYELGNVIINLNLTLNNSKVAPATSTTETIMQSSNCNAEEILTWYFLYKLWFKSAAFIIPTYIILQLIYSTIKLVCIECVHKW